MVEPSIIEYVCEKVQDVNEGNTEYMASESEMVRQKSRTDLIGSHPG